MTLEPFTAEQRLEHDRVWSAYRRRIIAARISNAVCLAFLAWIIGTGQIAW